MTLSFAFLLFPRVTQLDMTGPLQVLHRVPGAAVHLVARTRDPVPTDCGFSIVPTVTTADAPRVDLLCVPGGFGVEDVITDPELMSFVRRGAKEARWVTSVCTGAFVLGAAGLLEGRRATTHWAYRDLLPLVGAIPERARVVRDGNIVTGGGVTAGIDFGLELAAEIAGADVAREIQLAIEYDPSPPFDGSIDKAPDDTRDRLVDRYAKRREVFGNRLKALRG